jgi:hypothetical protein
LVCLLGRARVLIFITLIPHVSCWYRRYFDVYIDGGWFRVNKGRRDGRQRGMGYGIPRFKAGTRFDTGIA